MTDVERAHVATPDEWWNAFLDSIDEVQTADVKPTTEPAWWMAQVILGRAGIRAYPEYLTRARSIAYFRSPDGAGFAAAQIRLCHVVIDTDGNNIEAARLRAEVAAAEFELHDEQSVSQSLRLQLLAARQDIARLEAENARLQAQLGDGR